MPATPTPPAGRRSFWRHGRPRDHQSPRRRRRSSLTPSSSPSARPSCPARRDSSCSLATLKPLPRSSPHGPGPQAPSPHSTSRPSSSTCPRTSARASASPKPGNTDEDGDGCFLVARPDSHPSGGTAAPFTRAPGAGRLRLVVHDCQPTLTPAGAQPRRQQTVRRLAATVAATSS